MEKTKDIEHQVDNVKEKMVAMEEQLIKVQNDYKMVMMEIAEVKGNIGTESKVDLDSYRDAVQREVQQQNVQNIQITEKDHIKKAATQVQNRIDRLNNVVIYGVPEQINKNVNLSLRSEKMKQNNIIVQQVCAETRLEMYSMRMM